jgi:hypothetical protein
MARTTIPVAAIEFDSSGHTIWVQGLNGTVLRIKTLGKILVDQCTTNPCSHADIIVLEDIKICLSTDAED